MSKFKPIGIGIELNEQDLIAEKNIIIHNRKTGIDEKTTFQFDFLGAVQPYNPTDTEVQSIQFGNGNYSIQWYRIYTRNLDLDISNYNDKIIYNNKKFIIKAILPWNDYGYVEYRICTDFNDI